MPVLRVARVALIMKRFGWGEVTLVHILSSFDSATRIGGASRHTTNRSVNTCGPSLPCALCELLIVMNGPHTNDTQVH